MDEREEVAQLARAVREHLAWLERGGIQGLPAADPLPRERAGARVEPASPPLPSPAPPPAAAAVPERPANQSRFGDLYGGAGLVQIRADLGDCQRCKLAQGRNQIVFGAGSPDAQVVFVGEGPGAEEDRTGEPFVGAAGQLLDRMLGAMGLGRAEVYICNVVKCRPPENRTPEPEEVETCMPFLERQLAALRPRIIVALGKPAAQALLRSNASISSMRGRFHSYNGVPLMPTYHPAYLLRTPSAKRQVWDDLQKVMAEMDRLGLKRARGGEP